MNRDELFDKHLRGELTVEDRSQLKRLLSENADAGRAFVAHAAETTLLVRVGSQLQASRTAENILLLPSSEEKESQALAIPAGDEPETRVRRLARSLKWAAVAACVLAFALVSAALVQWSHRSSGAAVRLKGIGVQVMRSGALLHADEIQLKEGDIIVTPTNEMAVIIYQREATRMDIAANSVLQFGDDRGGKRFELRHGALRARVAPQPADKPLLVTTPQAQATVLGTEFLLKSDERATRLDVLEGKVLLACRANAKKVLVNAGYSASSTASGPSDAKPMCKCPKCRGTNEASNCPNLKKKNEN